MNLAIAKTGFKKVSDIVIPKIFFNRLKTGIDDIDKMFGNGILPGSSITLSAAPGCGKSTLLLQLCEALAERGYETGYASGEENCYQLAYTCKRLNVKNVAIANETDIDTLAAAMQNLDILVVDSFQALTGEEGMSSTALEKYACTTLIAAAKKHECAVIFIMHRTKAGQARGSTLIPHSVDVNMQITHDEESGDEYARIIETYKNRFGGTGSYSANMTSHGFEFCGKREIQAPQTKSQRRNTQLAKILAMDEPPGITKERVIKELEVTASQAYLLLKELTDSGKLVKYGKGVNASWKFKEVKVKS